MNIGSLIGRNARLRGDHLAAVFEDQRLTWGALEARVHRLANALHALGLRKGDKLALILPNCVELFDGYLAAARMGLVMVPVSPLLRGAGLSVLLRDCHASAVITCLPAERSGLLPELDLELLASMLDRDTLTKAVRDFRAALANA